MDVLGGHRYERNLMPKTEVTTTRIVWDDPDLVGPTFEFKRNDRNSVSEVIVTLGENNEITLSYDNFKLFAKLVADVDTDL